MKSLLWPLCLLFVLPLAAVAQSPSRYTISPLAKLPADSLLKTRLLVSLDGFLRDKDHPGQPSVYMDTAYLRGDKMGFEEIVKVENSAKRKDTGFYKVQLQNVIKLKQEETFLIKLGFVGLADGQPVVRMIYSIIGKDRKDRFVFYPARDYVIKDWKQQWVGNIHYLYPYTLDMAAARRFDRFNTTVAGWFGAKPVKLHYYHCSDAQELLRVKGVDYDANASYMRRGDSDKDNDIFMSGVGSPWYGHDLIHFYCDKFLPRPVNRAMEEGLAYYADGGWGESYATCLGILKKYAADHPGEDLYRAFKNNVSVGDISLKFTINALLLEEVIRRQGFPKALEVLKAENNDAGLEQSLHTHFGLTPANFNENIRKRLIAS
ncbi:hypothetical protein HHL17_04435 [Chitinophaga sp. G-6-1-13]|uniref:Uncharacterized protein n=1 Tax=Chitinophaga fulva TaxID=2728842 RepID=A0A848GCQ7_9BACT|nr:hypothetical protein [Chitinophaga fulva]NML36435.1 hypothetical protein [Chitinophaga fulva]